jgi:hypothetical protein
LVRIAVSNITTRRIFYEDDQQADGSVPALCVIYSFAQSNNDMTKEQSQHDNMTHDDSMKHDDNMKHDDMKQNDMKAKKRKKTKQKVKHDDNMKHDDGMKQADKPNQN